MNAETDTLFDGSEDTQHELNLSFVKMGALEDEYKQNGPCLLYSSLTNFGKEACSIMHNMSIIPTGVLSSQHRVEMASKMDASLIHQKFGRPSRLLRGFYQASLLNRSLHLHFSQNRTWSELPG